jgi:sulfhydrogenase subunit delta
MPHKPRLAVGKFASCDGCQLTLLDAEDELLAIAGAVEIVHFAEASSRLEPGPYDVTLVEGSITTPEDADRIRRLRRDSRYLVTIGACATAGGIQALRNFADHREFMQAVYARPDYIQTLATSTPIAAHVKVDFELRGCPIDKHQLLEVLASLLAGHKPRTSTESVCQPCKRRGTVCIVVAQGVACLGPVTQAGCGSICPAYDRGCYGCFGPARQPNLPSLSRGVLQPALPADEAARLLRNFHAAAPEFREESLRLLPLESAVPGSARQPSDPQGSQTP